MVAQRRFSFSILVSLAVLPGFLLVQPPISTSTTADPSPHASIVYGSISAGGSNSCGRRTNGRLVCWGKNDHGQSTLPIHSPGDFAQVSAGLYHTCAVRSTGWIACWGLNDYGQSNHLNIQYHLFLPIAFKHIRKDLI